MVMNNASSAALMMAGAGNVGGGPMGGGGGVSHGPPDSDTYDPTYCSIKLPPPQRLAPVDSPVAER